MIFISYEADKTKFSLHKHTLKNFYNEILDGKGEIK